MARICEFCKESIIQENDEYIELQIRILKTTENEQQDEQGGSYCDYCDTCIFNGSALKHLLEVVDYTLEPKKEN